MTILGLVAATGLRISEALHLRRDDVDLQSGLLHVRSTKFRKSRLVPLHPSVVTALQQYAHLRDRRCPTRATAFFVVDGGRALRDYQIHHAFHRIRLRLGWEPAPAHQRLPRIHDLRHTFACRRLLQWHRAGVDVEAHLIDLSTYLGHVKVTDTYWYLSGFPELLDFVGQRFERFARTSEE